MLVITNDRCFFLDYMNEDDLRSLIKTGCLAESRKWNSVLNEIYATLRDK